MTIEVMFGCGMPGTGGVSFTGDDKVLNTSESSQIRELISSLDSFTVESLQGIVTLIVRVPSGK